VDLLYNEFIPLQTACLPDYRDLIPGAAEAVAAFKENGIKVAATTGYNEEMTRIVLDAAARQGLEPDCAVCAAQVPRGRPAPWLIYRSMEHLNVYPPAAVVKIGDTIADIEAGLNAGVWTIGVVKTGNMLGLPLPEVQALSGEELRDRLERQTQRMYAAGAHWVVEAISACMEIMASIEAALAGGRSPQG
jgi:phosphonoacetaldehyde hydrolase